MPLFEYPNSVDVMGVFRTKSDSSPSFPLIKHEHIKKYFSLVKSPIYHS